MQGIKLDMKYPLANFIETSDVWKLPKVCYRIIAVFETSNLDNDMGDNWHFCILERFDEKQIILTERAIDNLSAFSNSITIINSDCISNSIRQYKPDEETVVRSLARDFGSGGKRYFNKDILNSEMHFNLSKEQLQSVNSKLAMLGQQISVPDINTIIIRNKTKEQFVIYSMQPGFKWKFGMRTK